MEACDGQNPHCTTMATGRLRETEVGLALVGALD